MRQKKTDRQLAQNILKGDFRAEYEKIIASGGDLSDCKKFYDDQKMKYGCRWSSDFHEWGTTAR